MIKKEITLLKRSFSVEYVLLHRSCPQASRIFTEWSCMLSAPHAVFAQTTRHMPGSSVLLIRVMPSNGRVTKHACSSECPAQWLVHGYPLNRALSQNSDNYLDIYLPPGRWDILRFCLFSSMGNFIFHVSKWASTTCAAPSATKRSNFFHSTLLNSGQPLRC